MKKSNYLVYIIGVFVIGILFFLLALPRINDPNRAEKRRWKEAGVRCLSGGHINLAQHIHPHLAILIDGEVENIDSEIGILQGCMSETHTHDSSGRLHIESVSANKKFTLGQFFDVWDKSIMREGYSLVATVDGELVEDVGGIIFYDAQSIVLEYKSTN